MIIFSQQSELKFFKLINLLIKDEKNKAKLTKHSKVILDYKAYLLMEKAQAQEDDEDWIVTHIENIINSGIRPLELWFE